MIPSIMAAWGMLMAVLVFGAPCRAFPAGAAVNQSMYTLQASLIRPSSAPRQPLLAQYVTSS
jgi:hypothetical protein